MFKVKILKKKQIIFLLIIICFIGCNILNRFLLKDNKNNDDSNNEAKEENILTKEYNWNDLLNKSTEWYKSDEAIELANEFLDSQYDDGGWRKYQGYPKSTIDNDATTSQIRFLAKTYLQTKNDIYKNSCLKGINLLINGQYENGGWPQYFNIEKTFLAYVTYNDNAMINVMYIMKEVASKNGDFTFVDDLYSKNAKIALEKGIKCILNTQIVVNKEKTAWAQQYDDKTLTPAQARAYEHPAISSKESTYIVKFLMSLENPSKEVKSSINSALEWFKKSKIKGVKLITTDDDRIIEYDNNAPDLWARFYEIETNSPMFSDRDGKIYYNYMDVSKERRSGYEWYGSWPNEVLR